MKQITCLYCGDEFPEFDAAHVCSRGLFAPKLESKTNTLFKKLACESATQVDKNEGEVFFTFNETALQEFVELIVQEGRPWLGYDAFEDIKRHLGLIE